ncbi:TPA: dTDP-4-amino-4,6-dideoxy-D-glucose aminotransferase VioA, partial [Escherichia coli]|nr:dTDP-4-amino-4,6-dideoxy-D-glucose aminotransferase VioA [Escherichia coli]EKT6335885.1 dTDP-4-amino-4,6-dideoxy-D-glucose aminotransferase VioA [Escherichia coli]HCQ2834902.1 dTDP-4-amino-4,6-dideoxy-D-glucose aminotransferase VioA [Escherichia coli]HDX7473860.1 dTDP-4-amino-4,6-dideoxy-D-glucose aminotransferase VioA [Escherichia coli]
MNDKTIPVTQPSLPELAEFMPYLEKIWKNKWLTNNGPFHQELEEKLCEFLGVQHISLFNNATIALITALQALRITGEVITTPYSFVATSHAILWNGLTPVFVDIENDGYNIDYRKIEQAITPKTSAILPVHCYSTPCEVEEIQKIADNYGLKVIYDAAHAFGVNFKGQSLLNYGDLSILSFHATKVFNTFEGGAIISPDAKTKLRIDRLKNFGIADELTVTAPGINGKMSEINAAFGLVQLKHIEGSISKRKIIDSLYRNLLKGTPGITIFPGNINANSNYSYFPILIDD